MYRTSIIAGLFIVGSQALNLEKGGELDHPFLDKTEASTEKPAGTTNNFLGDVTLGDVTLVIGGRQNASMVTSVQPSVALEFVDAMKEVLMRYSQQECDDAMIIDPNDETPGVGEEEVVDPEEIEDGETRPARGNTLCEVEESGRNLYTMMQKINTRNCPFLASLTMRQLDVFNIIFRTRVVEAEVQKKFPKDINNRNCPFLKKLNRRERS